MVGRGMDVDISKWEQIAHGPDGDSTSKRNNFPYGNAAASDFILSRLSQRHAHKVPDHSYVCSSAQSSLVSAFLLP